MKTYKPKLAKLPIKQKNTNIKFRTFHKVFPTKEIVSYQAVIRYLTLHELWFKEVVIDKDYYIITTTGTYCLEKKSCEFNRVREKQTFKVIPVEELTHFEPGAWETKTEEKLQKEAYKKPYNEPRAKMTPELVRAIRKETGTNRAVTIKYKSSASTIYNIRTGRIWGHIK